MVVRKLMMEINTKYEQGGTELVGKKTVGVCDTIKDWDTTDVDGELIEAGLVSNDETELLDKKATDYRDAVNVGGVKRNGGE